jgi:DNA repair photolyase
MARPARARFADLSAAPHKGRGALSNASGRYEAQAGDAFDDGWEREDEGALLTASVTPETAKSIISRNDSPDISFDRTANPYRGCEHGCVYCYARPNHAYVGLSPGLDFETKLFAKTNAAALLEEALRKPGYAPDVLMLSGVTDPYQPIEKTYQITRSLLEVLSACNHPTAIITKSALVLRDIDLLADMARRNLVKVALSITSLDPGLSRRLEPRATAPHRRLSAVRTLSEAGVPVSVMMAPIIPALNDHEIEALLAAVADTGAQSAGYVLLRLPLELKDLVHEWLDQHAPHRAARVKALIRDTRGGADYQAAFGLRQRGSGPYARQIAVRFKAALQRYGLTRPSLALDTSRFVPPSRPGDQASLL